MYRLLLILIFLPLLEKAQNSFADDALLQRLSDSLPKGWSMVVQDSELIISRHDSVWARHVNKISSASAADHDPNHKRQNDEEEFGLFKKEGWRTKSQITYRLEPQCGGWAQAFAIVKNDSIEKVISKLKAKYKIEGIYRRAKTDDVFMDSTDDQRERVRQYQAERKELESQYIIYPDYTSGKYSLFEKSSTGIDNASTAIWPPNALKEYYQVQELMLSILKNKVFR